MDTPLTGVPQGTAHHYGNRFPLHVFPHVAHFFSTPDAAAFPAVAAFSARGRAVDGRRTCSQKLDGGLEMNSADC
ncbi:hypothetical protein ACGFOU_10650 [Streptomyces sp. NPDC048595]|uniref:hypothetical protein n=1 Tax=Streptomyces sp. NPDC048595 TaxID=3365576 RepID=UPI003717D9C7